MIKALFKKQVMEVFSWVYYDRKNGRNRSKGGVIGFAALYLLIFVSLGMTFFGTADMLCKPLADAGLGWLYFALMGLLSVVLGVVGSVFNTYSSLYMAKDNDFLLSLPVPPGKILMVRLTGVYLMGLMYELIIAVPTALVYIFSVKQTFLSLLFNILIPFILSFFVLTLSCILGFCVAAISSRLKHKNIVTVILSLAFIAIYYYICGNSYKIIQSILIEPEKVGSSVKSILYPLYLMGLGGEGKILPFLIFTAMVAALFALTYLVLSKSFLSIATANKGTVKKIYREKTTKAASVEKALLMKELRHFTGCTVYMMNCGFGIVMMLIAAIAILIKGEDISAVIAGIPGDSSATISLMAAAVVGMLSTMNDITSPSISLEGKNIWILQSLPIPAKKILHAKLKLHLLLTIIPTAFLASCICIALKIPLIYAIPILAFAVIFVILMALIGLVLNLKMPNLNWTDITVPVKQSLCVMLALFGGWVIILALGGIYLLTMKFISPLAYLIIVSVMAAAMSAILLRWVDTKGTKIFETL